MINDKDALRDVSDIFGDNIVDLNNDDFEDIFCASNYGDVYDFASGASKGVLILPKGDEVIKIPFTKSCYDSDYETSSGEYYSCPFEINYCDLEYENYLLAKEYGVEQYFAAVRPLGNIYGVTIYAQEWCEADDFCSCSKDAKERASQIYQKSYADDAFDETWAGEFIERYGEEELERLYEFIYDAGINDLHCGNTGRRPNGDLVIIDYSGFNS